MVIRLASAQIACLQPALVEVEMSQIKQVCKQGESAGAHFLTANQQYGVTGVGGAAQG